MTSEPRLLNGGKRAVSSINDVVKMGCSHTNKVDSYLIPFINLRWIKDFNVRPKTITLLGENRGKLLDISLGSDFVNITPKAQAEEVKINK